MARQRSPVRVLTLGVLILAAFAALPSHASASFGWRIEKWGLIGAEETEPFTVSLKSGTTATIKGKVLGVEFVATVAEVVATGAKLEHAEKAKGSGVLEFKKMKVSKPAGCVISGEAFKTNKLIVEPLESGGVLYAKWFPESGEALGTMKIEKCAIAGSYPLKGVQYAQLEPAATTLVSQPMTFSAAIETKMGGSFTLGGSAAELAAEMNYSLSGINVGEAFSPESAPATILCEENASPCVHPYTVPTVLSGSLMSGPGSESTFSFDWNGEGFTVNCINSAMEAESTLAGAPLGGLIDQIILGAEGLCINPTCIMASLRLPYNMELEAVGGGKAEMRMRARSHGNPVIEVNCGEGQPKCIYEVKNQIVGRLEGGNPAILKIHETKFARIAGSEVVCGFSAVWDAEYAFAPKPLFAVS